jgi:hypothetical protein
MAIVASLESQAKALASLSMHSQRLSDIMEMHESKGERYRPSADGFVFSNTQIDPAMRARNRDRLAEKAYNYRLRSA